MSKIIDLDVPVIDYSGPKAIAGYGFSFDVSPCKRHPVTGEPCEYKNQCKDLPPCSSCRIRFGRENIDGFYDYQHEVKIKVCEFPGCNKTLQNNKFSYCGDHGPIVYKRKHYWDMKHPGETIPYDILYAPVKRRAKRRNTKRKGPYERK